MNDTTPSTDRTTETPGSTAGSDGPLFALTRDLPPRPLPGAVGMARTSALAAATGILAMPADAFEEPWQWPGHGEVELRYAAFRVAELFERAEIDVAASLAAAGARDPAADRAAAIIGPATAARWDLQGLLLPLDAATVDAEPAAGEWSIRLTMGHIIGGQRAYAWGTAWFQHAGLAIDDPGLLTALPASFWDDIPDEATTEAAGTPAELRARLDEVLDRAAERLAGMSVEQLAHGGRWSGVPVDLAFRLGRWSSHIREHVIQVEKSLVWLGREPSEPERLARLAMAAYGRAEAQLFGRARADAAAELLAAASAEAAEIAASMRRAA